MKTQLSISLGLSILFSGCHLSFGDAPHAPSSRFLPLEAISESIFDQPHDLVLSPDGKYLLVADLGNNEIKVLDAESLILKEQFGKADLDSPHDLIFTQKGLLLVADSGNNRIAIYTMSGTRGTLSGTLQADLDSPEGVSEGADGRIYVTSTKDHRLVAFKDGGKVAEKGKDGDSREKLNRPHDVLVDADGRIWIADAGNNRILEMNSDFSLVQILGGPGYSFNEPKYLALNKEGWLFVADEFNHQIRVLDNNRRPRFGISGGVNLKNQEFALKQPEGVVVSELNLWVSDTRNNRILRLKLPTPEKR